MDDSTTQKNKSLSNLLSQNINTHFNQEYEQLNKNSVKSITYEHIVNTTYDKHLANQLQSLVSGLKHLVELRSCLANELSKLSIKYSHTTKGQAISELKSLYDNKDELIESASFNLTRNKYKSTILTIKEVGNECKTKRQQTSVYNNFQPQNTHLSCLYNKDILTNRINAEPIGCKNDCLEDYKQKVANIRHLYKEVELNLECPIRRSLELLTHSNTTRLKAYREQSSNNANKLIKSVHHLSPRNSKSHINFTDKDDVSEEAQPPIVVEDLPSLLPKLERKSAFLRERKQTFVQEMCDFIFYISPTPFKNVGSFINNNLIAANLILSITGAHLPNLLTTMHHSMAGSSYSHQALMNVTPDLEINGALSHTCQLLRTLTDFYELSLPFPIDLQSSPPKIREILMDPNKEILLLREKTDSFPLVMKNRGDNINALVGVSLLNRNIVYVCQAFSIPVLDPNRTLYNLKNLLNRILDEESGPKQSTLNLFNKLTFYNNSVGSAPQHSKPGQGSNKLANARAWIPRELSPCHSKHQNGFANSNNSNNNIPLTQQLDSSDPGQILD